MSGKVGALMNLETKYRYQKRIEELEREIDRLRPYRDYACEVRVAMVDVLVKGQGALNISWLLSKMNWLFR